MQIFYTLFHEKNHTEGTRNALHFYDFWTFDVWK